ncbi:hypothetical protein KEK_17668 [Mycolicibacterium thermoresistibile ATCC 19527]|uniref:Uncharacterized protein n=1 Tax=Mycolicibacterium thermoresistibile (strain ATCC 19527 / DSM 44167 / CIP 105390 / JCM 6362 / NCTC 10409 / 316) TaxID=1078020 RepID=G7CJF3_MYCT3|nr:hypothetical protein KEK_17668 [Mycolicibacterium thermoresistibile ATCC 19527]
MILAILGWIFGLNWLWVLGIVLAVVGVVFWLLGRAGRPVAGRRAWY